MYWTEDGGIYYHHIITQRCILETSRCHIVEGPNRPWNWTKWHLVAPSASPNRPETITDVKNQKKKKDNNMCQNLIFLQSSKTLRNPTMIVIQGFCASCWAVVQMRKSARSACSQGTCTKSLNHKISLFSLRFPCNNKNWPNFKGTSGTSEKLPESRKQ